MKRAFAALLAATTLGGCISVAATEHRGEPRALAPAQPTVPAGMQWLYGSGESAAASVQTYRALAGYAIRRAGERRPDGVVLAEGSPLFGGPGRPVRHVPCGDKPRAVVFDADETLIWNLGYEYWQAMAGRPFSAPAWDEWERTGGGQVVAMPGAVQALERLRRAGITPVVNSNRLAANATQTAATLARAGLGEFVHGRTMFLRGDDAAGGDKDARRARIAARYCVVAMAGDNLGDFSDTFNARETVPAERRRLASATDVEGGVEQLWGDGWFLFANPVYGPSLAGDYDSVFPADRRWTPQEGRR